MRPTTGVYLVLVAFFIHTDGTKVKCPPISQTDGVDLVTCKFKSGLETKCQVPSHIGTTALYTCKPFYKTSPSNSSKCLSNGTWSTNVKCISIHQCGQRKGSVTLIMHGARAQLGEWPWAAGLYYIMSNTSWEFLCGGTLVSDNAVITAAHCVWDSEPEEFAVTLGNIYRSNSPLNEKNETTRQIFKVKEIAIPETYQDSSGNYGSDLAILFLDGTVTLSLYVRPICLPWNLNLSHQNPNPGDMVTVAGWGLDETRKPSEFLKFVQIPIVSWKECIEQEPWDFRKYITYTTFCAGFLNGTNACNGDSGSGMLYYNKKHWELVGIVSVSPRQQGTQFCHQHSHAMFTKVASYIPWLYTKLGAHN